MTTAQGHDEQETIHNLLLSVHVYSMSLPYNLTDSSPKHTRQLNIQHFLVSTFL